jgi:hypothetical protein
MVRRSHHSFVNLSQTEVAEFKVDGLALMIEGIGRAKSEGRPALQALGLITFDDAAGTYRMRAFNDGRWLEAEVKLFDDGKSLSWALSSARLARNRFCELTKEGTDRAR